MYSVKHPLYTGGRRTPKRAWRWNVAEVAPMLTKEKPFFHMASGGTYAVKVERNDLPICFIRMDRDHRPVKERKAARRKLKEAKNNGRS